MRFFGALAILAVGAIHLQQYIGDDYSAIPTIGTLFLLNAIASAVVGIGLLAPIKRVVASHTADAAIGLLALGAVAIAVGALIALFISETGSLFGFTESGYRAAVVVAIVAEAATIALLGPVATVNLARVVSRRQRTAAERRGGATSRLGYGAGS
jgi:multisubunit Na+/H+ antiporter MnhF subunit